MDATTALCYCSFKNLRAMAAVVAQGNQQQRHGTTHLAVIAAVRADASKMAAITAPQRCTLGIPLLATCIGPTLLKAMLKGF
jgi:hypothetical protein